MTSSELLEYKYLPTEMITDSLSELTFKKNTLDIDYYLSNIFKVDIDVLKVSYRVVKLFVLKLEVLNLLELYDLCDYHEKMEQYEVCVLLKQIITKKYNIYE